MLKYASYAAIEFLILGASSKHGFIRFRTSDVPSHVMKSIPDFCTVYVISKAKISSAKKSSRAPPFPSPLREKIQEQTNNNFEASVRRKNSFNLRKPEKAVEKPVPVPEDPEAIRSPFNRGRGLNVKLLCGELSDAEADLSFISSERPSASDRSFQSPFLGAIGDDMGSMFSSTSMDSRVSTSTRADDVDNEMRRLKMELQRTMEMYSSACKDALTAQQKAGELERWRVEEAQRVSEAKIGDEQSREVAETEKERYQALMAKARASRRIADLESEKQALEHPEEEKHQDSSDKQQREFRYRRYTIDEIEKATEFFTEARKIGEGGYGPVFKGRLDNTTVAIKVLRPDAAQGRSQFQQEDDVDNEMRRLKMELQRTMEMYSSACKDALTAQQKAGELERWRVEEAQRVSEAKIGDEQSREVAETEKERYQALMAKARASRRIADLESEKQALEHPEEEKHQDSSDKQQREFRYRRYTIDEIEKATEFFTEARKIGEGGYGPVFKGRLDNTTVAIKVLRPDAAQGRSQFQQEVEVLSCMRHPNMVLLLGACPEYGCLVYEYMSNGSLEDRLLRRGNTPPLPWQIRFKIAAEIATGMLFLHQTKPEPIVHRDLKPGNILLDRNFVSKISDVGLARLLPASSLTEDVSQYRMTSAAGTMCYIDPEYQQTGMLGVKSDVYSLGIMLLQLVTAKPAMGLAHHVRRAINKGNFDEMLDPTVHDWPVEEAFGFAKLSIQCAELRRKDRPDLGKVVLPELNRLREFGEEKMTPFMAYSTGVSQSDSQNSLAP
nr:U-box domain-containing protein 35-like [Tanacetum cinerariifolium]